MDKDMLALASAPLADPLKLFLPRGVRSPKRGTKPVYEGDFAPRKLSRKALAARHEKAIDDKLNSILDYYATTSVPFERIAEHTKIPLDRVRVIMAARGRSA